MGVSVDCRGNRQDAGKQSASPDGGGVGRDTHLHMKEVPEPEYDARIKTFVTPRVCACHASMMATSRSTTRRVSGQSC